MVSATSKQSFNLNKRVTANILLVRKCSHNTPHSQLRLCHKLFIFRICVISCGYYCLKEMGVWDSSLLLEIFQLIINIIVTVVIDIFHLYILSHIKSVQGTAYMTILQFIASAGIGAAVTIIPSLRI